MSGFTKLVPEIIQSSIWNESAEIRCVWIAMIATKDENGYVRGDTRTIARMANVSIESATAALDMFQQPDLSSHTPDNEGRRIMPAPGGWIILNHDIYRARDEVYREKTRERVRRFRKNMEQSVNDVTLQETLLKRNPSASASASSSASGSSSEGDAGKPKDAIEADFEDAWMLYPDKSGKQKAFESYRKWRKTGDTQDQILSGLNRYMAYVKEKQKTKPDYPFKNGSSWFHQRGWMDEYTCKVSSAPSKPNPKELYDRNVNTIVQSALNCEKGQERKDYIHFLPTKGFTSAEIGAALEVIRHAEKTRGA